MVELAIYAREDIPDAELHPMRYRLGDVVDTKPDGAPWGREELKPGSPFRIVACPGLSQQEVEDFLGGLPIQVDHNLSAITQERRRALNFDITHPALPSEFIDWWHRDDGTKFVLNDLHPRTVARFHPSLPITARPA